MDRRKTDAEGGGGGGGRVVHRHNRTSKLTVVVVLQNLLVAACLIVTLYVHWTAYQEPEGNIRIEFLPITEISGNTTLKFDIFRNNKMDLIRNDTISIECTGPYVLYMYACYKSLHGQEVTGELQLQVVKNINRFASVTMNTSSRLEPDCRGLHSITYLTAGEKAILRLNSTQGFKLKNVTVGLSYLLGTQCEN